MSRLAPALRIRRRELDLLRLAIATEQRSLSDVNAAAAALAERQKDERRLATTLACSSDDWFAEASRRLHSLGEEGRASLQRLARLRAATVEAQARLSLLEEAERVARRVADRAREQKAQDRLDDRTAASWGDR